MVGAAGKAPPTPSLGRTCGADPLVPSRWPPTPCRSPSWTIVDNAVLLLVPGAMDARLGSPLFWGALALALAVAFVVTVPVDRCSWREAGATPSCTGSTTTTGAAPTRPLTPLMGRPPGTTTTCSEGGASKRLPAREPRQHLVLAERSAAPVRHAELPAAGEDALRRFISPTIEGSPPRL